jgi:hypothetical protein
LEGVVYVVSDFGERGEGPVGWFEEDWSVGGWDTVRREVFVFKLLSKVVEEGEESFLEVLIGIQNVKEGDSFVHMTIHFSSKVVHPDCQEAVLAKEGKRDLSVYKKVGQNRGHIRLNDQERKFLRGGFEEVGDVGSGTRHDFAR